MKVRLIEWLRPLGERDLANPIAGFDFITKRINIEREYNVGDSNIPLGEDNANMEYVIDVIEPEQEFNVEIEYQNELAYPTQEAHPDYPEYHIFKVRTLAQKREIESMVFSIKSKEAESNNTLKVDGQLELASMLVMRMGVTLGEGKLSTPEMKLGKFRFDEIYERMGNNMATSIEKIRLAKTGQPYDLESGWEIDTLTPLGSPFNDIEG